MFTGSGTGSVPAFPRRRFWQMPSAIAAGVPSCGQAPPNPTGGTSATEIEWPGSVSAGFTRFRWTLWNIGPVVTGPMFHRADGGPVGGPTRRVRMWREGLVLQWGWGYGIYGRTRTAVDTRPCRFNPCSPHPAAGTAG